MTQVRDANIAVHSALADRYNSDEPHFRPENQEKVRGRLSTIAGMVGGGRLLDVGCGTGFIIHLAADLFDKIDGVDITQAMMDQVDLSKGNITLTRTPAENLPFKDAEFDAASAYSFLDHLEDYSAVLREVARVLKTGGVFYIDLVPNRYYWQALASLNSAEVGNASAFVQRERRMVTANDQDVAEKYGIDATTFRVMEPVKEQGGLDIEEFSQAAKKAGFSAVEVNFDWFLGQAKVMHDQSFDDASVVSAYLAEAMPLTRHMFKYVWFTLRK